MHRAEAKTNQNGGGKKAAGTAGELKRVTQLQIKQTLKLSQCVAAIEGSLYDTFLGPVDHPEPTHMSEQTSASFMERELQDWLEALA